MPETKKGKILILYYHNIGYPMRMTSQHMLYCFEKYCDAHCYYVNCAFGAPDYLKDIEFDLIIFHHILLSKRSLPRRFYNFMEQCAYLKDFKGYKVATVQDEFKRTKLLGKFIRDFGIQHIFSVAMPSEWPKIYQHTDYKKLKFSTMLTGYIEENDEKLMRDLSKNIPSRTIDVGYRAAYNKRYSLGEHGLLKTRIAEIFSEKLKSTNLNYNISTLDKDALKGHDWYKFMLSSKYTLGVESGASVLDEEGKAEEATAEYVKLHPEADFYEVREHCFKDLDNKLKLFAIGPRHLEAAIARTCQVLVEGEYNGIFKPWKHYIPLKSDFSNVDEVIELIKKDGLRQEIVETSYRDIVESGKYTFRSFVKLVVEDSLGVNYQWSSVSAMDERAFEKNKTREKGIWQWVKFYSPILEKILYSLPTSMFLKIENFMKKGG